jgi:RNA polymerase sigma factor (sigma-70 family)
MDWEDLTQIGMIALWEAEQSFEASRGSLPHWLTFKARGVMKDAIRQRAKHAAYKNTAPEEALLDIQADCGSAMDRVIAAYHEGEVAKALDLLTDRQREYVRLRFWEGKGTAEMIEHFGYDPRGVWRGAKQKLVPALEHLVAES